ncbi:MAG: C10 family peptidase, partial [Muribaculum sp.]|nr:C10 family peptidase [Muribaculum sp.]
SHPYNLMTPTLSDGNNAVTGCVNTAQAQVMNYYEWPKQGRGVVSYELDGVLLSADLDKSVYNWDNMLDSYTYSSGYSDEQAKAVALLMRDCGYANKTYYNVESGADVNKYALINNFGYDKGMRSIERDNCSLEEYEAFMRQEIDAGRPILVAGGSSGGAHEFICDGYDDKGYFHYNFGWDGWWDGYFLSSATGYDSSPSLLIGIHPDKGGKAIITAGSHDDFYWDGIKFWCNLEIRCCIEEPVEFQSALALRNIATGEVKYYNERHTLSSYDYITYMQMPKDLPDGDYVVYPVVKQDGYDWMSFTFFDGRQRQVDLKVSGGEYLAVNNGLTDKLDEGKVEVDGVFYILNDDGTAEVTYKNDKFGSYSGDVTVPASIEYDGVNYSVTSIGDSAFKESSIDDLLIGKNVTLIGFGSFSFATVGNIEFAPSSRLTDIGGWAFNAARIGDLSLPHGLRSLGTCAFQSASLKRVRIPSTVNKLNNIPFNYCTNLTDVYVYWKSRMTLANVRYLGSDHIFNGCDLAKINLHIPPGSSNAYSQTQYWCDLNLVEDESCSLSDVISDSKGEVLVIDGQLSVLGKDAVVFDIAGRCVASIISDGSITLPKGIYIVSFSDGKRVKISI